MSVDVAVIASKCDEKFTRSDLLKKGATHNSITKAIDDGVLKVLNTTRSTGKRGKPARHLQLTAKGAKAAAKA